MSDAASNALLRHFNVDLAERVAVGASLACLVHCLALPLLLSVLPAISAIVAIPESFHLWALAVATPLALLALSSGRRRHGQPWPLRLGVVGLCLLLAGGLVRTAATETGLTVLGSMCLATAHITNWRRRHACSCQAEA